MKKLILFAILLTAFACQDEPQVKKTMTVRINGKIREVEIIDHVAAPPGNGCLDGSPAGYCCVYTGPSVQCFRN
jgi:hypothetical protein